MFASSIQREPRARTEPSLGTRRTSRLLTIARRPHLPLKSSARARRSSRRSPRPGSRMSPSPTPPAPRLPPRRPSSLQRLQLPRSLKKMEIATRMRSTRAPPLRRRLTSPLLRRRLDTSFSPQVLPRNTWLPLPRNTSLPRPRPHPRTSRPRRPCRPPRPLPRPPARVALPRSSREEKRPFTVHLPRLVFLQAPPDVFSNASTDQGGAYGACGVIHPDSDPIVALELSRYGTGSNNAPDCGRKVLVTNSANGKSVTATVADVRAHESPCSSPFSPDDISFPRYPRPAPGAPTPTPWICRWEPSTKSLIRPPV
jgi:hypothetical protein